MDGKQNKLAPLKPLEGLIRGRYGTSFGDDRFVIDTDFFDWNEKIHLYRNGIAIETQKSPASFDLGNGARIEAEMSLYGMKRVHLIGANGESPVMLDPVEGTAEHWRFQLDQRFPLLSRVIGVGSIIVLILAIAIDLPPFINMILHHLERIGFPHWQIPTLPISGPWLGFWAIFGVIAAIERGLSMKYNPWLD